MSRIIFLFALLTAWLVTGCSSLWIPQSSKTSLPSPAAFENGWMINMTYSGGIMGLSRSIEISSNGKYTVADNRADKMIIGELAGNELSKLNGIILESKFAPTKKLQFYGCADCFMFSLEVQMNGEKFAYKADEITLSSSGLEALVIYLRDLMDKTLK